MICILQEKYEKYKKLSKEMVDKMKKYDDDINTKNKIIKQYENDIEQLKSMSKDYNDLKKRYNDLKEENIRLKVNLLILGKTK